ncbi:Protein transport protein sft2 [Podospora pseudocomata]|uniref:Protein transport protein SFT2 n=1 Tax=Podospora pseudocomata TaxID=2093779 RepID=A0ABR0GVI6_9PEZI|nr:Protein transport protein sft2 [Podospora pseudocomata]
MASSSFRNSINSLGWARRDTDLPVHTSRQTGLFSSLQSLNPFGGRGYVQLPTTEGPGAPLPAPSRREEEEGWFALSRWDRLLIFAACNIAALVCFVLVIALFPALSLARPRKLMLLWTLGSILFLSSFAAVMGPWAYVQHLTSTPRLPFTAAYFGSLGLTIYFSIGLQSTILTILSGLIQLGCLIWYLVSYFPMGSSGLRLVSSFGARRAATWMTG